jgi:hypothetical protein
MLKKFPNFIILIYPPTMSNVTATKIKIDLIVVLHPTVTVSSSVMIIAY